MSRVTITSYSIQGILIISMVMGLAGFSMADPVVSGVTAAQRGDGSGLVDVYYDLSGVASTVKVTVTFSNDDGVHWNVLPTESMLSGDFGFGIGNGTGKHIVWDAGRDRAEVYWPQTRARVAASEIGQTLNLMLPGGVPLEMVRIPSGYFQMGSTDDPGYSQPNEAPAHSVSIDYEFFIGKFEITQGQWFAVMGSVPSDQTQTGPDYPVAYVSWDDCQSFVTALNALGLGSFRLPSEAEWEYACRAGSNTRWCFGDDVGQLVNYAWYSANNSPSGVKIVGSKLPNVFGLYDMHGNVYEWVQDWYHSTYTGAPTDGSAWEDPTGTSRVLRGGFCYSSAAYCRSAHRYYNSPGNACNGYGVRIVRTP